MTLPASPASVEATDRLRLIDAGLGLPAGALGGLLLSVVERIGAGWAVKQIGTGRYLHADPRFAAWAGREPAQLVGCTDTELFGPEPGTALHAADQTAVAQGDLHRASHRIERDRQRRDFDVLRQVLMPASGSSPGLLGCVWLETTAAHLREAQLLKTLAQLEQQQVAVEALRREGPEVAPRDSLRDAVTGLYQRGHFDDQLRREVDLSSREHREFALVAIRLDPPAEATGGVRDEAHQRVLESLGRLLRNNTRAMDASCRVDADHFAVLLSGVGLATAHSRMEGLRRQCATQIVVLAGREIGFTVSMGVASFPHTAHSQDELMAAADLALAEATRRGGNHVTLASIRFER